MNKAIFPSTPGRILPKTDAVNEAGGKAYSLPPKAALAQYALTGCLNGTYYASGEAQVDRIVALAAGLPDDFVAKLAVYARDRGHMKDVPALLLAILAVKSPMPAAAARAFPAVLDNGKMLRNFVQTIRSGVLGRKSFGSAMKRLVRNWLRSRDPVKLFEDKIGNDPSLADILKMIHPKPADAAQAALFRYIVKGGTKELSLEHAMALPAKVLSYEAFRTNPEVNPLPDVPHPLLQDLPLSEAHWKEIGRRMRWTALRMNLNTLARHGVLKDVALVAELASNLKDPETVRKVKAFPYQLLMAYRAASDDVPLPLREALQDAMEIATENVPELPGLVVVCPDVSGSMSSPVTGHRKGSTTAVRVIDVAAFVTASVMRKNPSALVLPFAVDVVPIRLNPRDSVMTNADKLALIGGGGTNVSAPLAALNAKGINPDLVIYVSDQEAWLDRQDWAGRGTATMQEWRKLKARSPNTKLVLVNVQPYETTQAPTSTSDDVMNISGWSDACFDFIAGFASGNLSADALVGEVEKVEL